MLSASLANHDLVLIIAFENRGRSCDVQLVESKGRYSGQNIVGNKSNLKKNRGRNSIKEERE